MKATAIAPANIAFIKYWGKKDSVLRIPYNSSLSMNLSQAYTTTTVEFSPQYNEDMVASLDGEFSESEKQRVSRHLDRFFPTSGRPHGRVVTKNTFPKSAGLASSASGFAALTLAASRAAKSKVTEKELTILARLGSGSACRSMPDGFVEWIGGSSSASSYAHSLFPASHWDLCDVIAMATDQAKKVSTTDGMKTVTSSPFWNERLTAVEERLKRLKKALKDKDLSSFGRIVEAECINLHAVMMTQEPPLFYWSEMTIKIMQSVQQWRGEGLPVYFTIDAGPNVHLVCELKTADLVSQLVSKIPGVYEVMVNTPARGAHLIQTDLF